NGSPDTYTRLMTEIMTSLSPAGYQPTSASIQLWQDGSPIVDRPLLGGGRAWLENGVPININKEYSLVYVLNGGDIESQPFRASLYQPVFASPLDGKEFISEISVDLSSDWSCTRGSSVGFTLNHKAIVTATVGDQEVLSRKELDKGYHSLSYVPQPGFSDYHITAISTLDGHVETRSGRLITSLKYDPLPVGNTLVEGVNLHNGSLSLNRVDFSL